MYVDRSILFRDVITTINVRHKNDHLDQDIHWIQQNVNTHILRKC